MSDDAVGDASDQQPCDRVMSVTTDDDQVYMFRRGDVHDGSCRMSDDCKR